MTDALQLSDIRVVDIDSHVTEPPDLWTSRVPKKFRRQCYGSFWFEQSTLPLLELYPNNFMFETDYPHPTGLSPGPASPAELPSVHIAKGFSDVVPLDVARKVLYQNAANVYHLD